MCSIEPLRGELILQRFLGIMFILKLGIISILLLWMSKRIILYLFYYQAGFCFNQRTWPCLSAPEGSSDLKSSEAVRPSLRCSPSSCASRLLLELITLSGETKYSGHTVGKKVHSITKLLSTDRLLPFIKCERWNSLLVKGNGCFTALPQINTCGHFPFSPQLQKSNYTEEMLTINRLVR